MADKKVIVNTPSNPGKKPFVLIWADEAAIKTLKSANAIFSEAHQGLADDSIPFESPETTGGPQNEGADTTFS